MSDTITLAMIDAFNANVILLSQEEGSQLQSTVLNDSRNAERASRDRLGTVDLVQKTSRHGDTPYTPIPHSRRWATPVPFEGSDYIDEADDVRTIADFESPYAMTFAYAAGRKQDETILRAANGTAVTGRDHSGTQALPGGQQVAVNNHDHDSGSGDAGLSVGKLIAAKKILINGGVSTRNRLDELHIAVNGTQLANMLEATEVTSADFNRVKALVDGDVDQFMGFKFHTFDETMLETDSSNDELVICWAKSGIWLNEPLPPVTRVDEIPTKSYSKQIFMRIMTSAVRLDDAKVVEIACDPT